MADLMTDPAPLGRLIQTHREQRGMSRSQLAAEASMTYPYIHALETGRQFNPSMLAAMRLSRALGITLDALGAATTLAHSTAKEADRAE